MNTTQNIPRNYDDVIDSRQVIEAIASLADELDDMNEDERHDYDALVSLAEEAEQYAPDWEYGETLIRDSYFTDYARELVDECGYFDNRQTRAYDYTSEKAIDWNAWPYNCIDWTEVARKLQQDYTSVDFDGVTYWVR